MMYTTSATAHKNHLYTTPYFSPSHKDLGVHHRRRMWHHKKERSLDSWLYRAQPLNNHLRILHSLPSTHTRTHAHTPWTIRWATIKFLVVLSPSDLCIFKNQDSILTKANSSVFHPSQQILYNTVIISCTRKKERKSYDNSYNFSSYCVCWVLLWLFDES